MSFVDLSNLDQPPKRLCDLPSGSLLEVFPPKQLEARNRLGYHFRSEPCNSFLEYNADVCVPGVQKMAPDLYGPEKEASLKLIQAAFQCATIGATDEELRYHARNALERNLWRSVDQTLVDMLNAEAVVVPVATPLSAICAHAKAAQFLATNSQCGTGIIYGSTDWFTQTVGAYGAVIKEGNAWKDIVGNTLIPSSIDLQVVYAFDSEIDLRTYPIEILDEYATGARISNTRLFRAEQVYTLALDNCAVGTIELEPVCE